MIDSLGWKDIEEISRKVFSFTDAVLSVLIYLSAAGARAALYYVNDKVGKLEITWLKKLLICVSTLKHFAYLLESDVAK